MLDVGVGILNIVMVITTMWIVNRFWGSFYEKKKRSIFSVGIWIVFFLYQLGFQSNRGNINIGITCINAFLILEVAICNYHSKGKEKFFLLAIFYGLWTLVEVFVFFC